MIRLALFASGSGSNVENIYNYFSNNTNFIISKVYCNNANAGVLERCKRLNLKSLVFKRHEFFESSLVLKDLIETSDVIVLAGFLWKIPENIIQVFSDKIINIHPALLPKYGGKGMYGMNVHKTVKENNDAETGITIHFVNEKYDDGAIIFQEKTSLKPSDSIEEIAQKVHELEYKYYPKIIEQTFS